MLQMEPQSSSSPSSTFATPSFSSYSSQTLAQIAARVIHQLSTLDNNPNQNHHGEEEEEEEDNFEFPFLSLDHNSSSPVSADHIFSNGHIMPTYPLFDRTLLYDHHDVVSVPETPPPPPPPPPRRLPLRKLMFEEERGDSSSVSSDESNELNGVPEGSYCVWTPPGNNNKKKKSNSMGSSSSKRWKLRDLLLRSNSDGKKGPFLFMGPTKRPSTDGNGAHISTLN